MAGMFDDIVAGVVGPPAASTPAPAPAQPANMFADIVNSVVPPASPGPQAPVPPPITTGNLTAGPAPSLGERAYTAADNAFQGTLLGAGSNAVGAALGINPAPLADPYTGQPIPGSYQSPEQNYANEPPAQGVLGQAATVLGTVAGGAASPEGFVAGPEGYGAVRAGEALLPTILRSAGEQAVVQGGANAAAQAMNITDGEQTGGFSVPQALESAGMGAGLGAVGPLAGAAVNAVKGDATNMFSDIVRSVTGEDAQPTSATEMPETATPQTQPAAPAASTSATPGMFDDIVQSVTKPEETPAPTPPAAAPAEITPKAAPTANAPIQDTPAPTAQEPAAQLVLQPEPGTELPVSQSPGEAAPVEQGGPASPVLPQEPGVAEAGSGNTSSDLAPDPVPEQDAVPASVSPVPEAEAPTVPELQDTASANPAPTIEPPTPGNFNSGTSPYVQVFRDAGHDPDVATSYPIQRQNEIIRQHVANTFGLKDIEIDRRQDPKEVRDQLSNFYQNGREMSAALGMPHKALGLDGDLTLSTKPFTKKTSYLGAYSPGSKTITLPGRTNSWAHEWTHALDHHLSQELGKNPNAMKMLSRSAETARGEPGGKVPMPGSTAEGFAGVMRAIYGKDAKDAADALRMQYEAKGRDPAKAMQAEDALRPIQSKFVENAKSMGDMAKYYADPAELLARSHEAYVADAIKTAGGDTRAVAKDKYSGVNDTFDKLYPQEDDKARIFQAYRDMHDAMRREEILGDHAGQRPDGQDILDPTQWHKMADTKAEPGLTNALRREAQAFKNTRQTMRERMGYNDNAAHAGYLNWKQRTGDVFANTVATARTVGNRIVKRAPKGAAKDAFQEIMDKLTPAEHVRDGVQAGHHIIGQTYEEDVRLHGRGNVNRFTDILEAHKLDKMTAEHELMLRHVMTEGDKPFTSGGGQTTAIPANIKAASGKLRYLMDQEWERNKAAGIDVGYARSGYFPRMFDDYKIAEKNGAGFKVQAAKLHSLMFDKDVGDDPEKLLAAHDRLTEPTRDTLDPETQANMQALRRNLKSQDKLTSRIETAADGDKPALQAKLDALKSDAGDLHDASKDQVQKAYAKAAAQHWFTRINAGDPTDFDTRGPNSSYTQGRKLPPEADEIMRDYMVNRPTEAIPAYFQASARKVAFAKRFGNLDELMEVASHGGARMEDIAAMRRLVEHVTGRTKSGLPPPVETGLNTIHAMGSVALMPRAMWSSLSEPMSVLVRTGNMKATYEAFANQIGDIARTAGSKQRAEMANALGITVSHLHDSIINDRTNAHYDDSPRLSKLMTNFYARTGLTALTNSQRRSVMSAGHTALGAWSRDVEGSNARLARDGAAQLRELGVPDAHMPAFNNFMKNNPGLPSLKALETPEGQLWGQAVSRLTDKLIQDPGKMDKPLLSQSPGGRLGFGLMGFSYSWFHNVMDHFVETHIAKVKEGYHHEGVGGAASALGRAGVHASVAAAGTLGASLIASTLRERLFNSDQWAEHEKKGDLGSWLTDLAVQRTGINGPMDPIIQALSGLKYQRDLTALTAGAQGGYFLQAAANIAKAFVAPSANTNSTDYSGITGAWQLLGVPAMATLFSALPGGPIAGKLEGAALQEATSPGVGDALATAAVGEKGTPVGGAPDQDAGDNELAPDDADNELAPEQETQQNGSGVPWGLADDVAAPALRVGRAALPFLPGPVKAAGVGVGALLGATGLAREFGRFAGDGTDNGQ
jgi:hypothetical protein